MKKERGYNRLKMDKDMVDCRDCKYVDDELHVFEKLGVDNFQNKKVYSMSYLYCDKFKKRMFSAKKCSYFIMNEVRVRRFKRLCKIFQFLSILGVLFVVFVFIFQLSIYLFFLSLVSAFVSYSLYILFYCLKKNIITRKLILEDDELRVLGKKIVK